jgi:hypothetical protein
MGMTTDSKGWEWLGIGIKYCRKITNKELNDTRPARAIALQKGPKKLRGR